MERPQAPELPEALTGRVAFQLRLALIRAETMGKHALTELGITGREYGILALLADAQHRPGCPASTRSHAGHRPDDDGEDPRRARTARTGPPHPRPRQPTGLPDHLTEAGDRLRDRAAAVLETCDDNFLTPLSATDRERLRTLLSALS